MDLPSQVQAGADRADQLIAEQAALMNGAQDTPSAGDDPANPATQHQNPANPEHTVETLTAKVGSLTQQLTVLQGKYNSEIKELGDNPNLLNTQKAELRKLRRQVTDFSRIISDQQHTIAKMKSDDPPAADPKKNHRESTGSLTQEEIDYLNSEGLSDRAIEIFSKVGQSPDGELSTQVKELREEAASSKQDRFFQGLTEAVPNWRKINADSEDSESTWVKYLNGKAPFQNRTINEVLNEAQANLDVATCADIFNNFIRMSPPPADPETEVVGDPPRINPADHIEPGSSVASQPPAPAPQYTMAEYKAHYDYGAKNPRVATTKEWKDKAAILDKAYAAGQIK